MSCQFASLVCQRNPILSVAPPTNRLAHTDDGLTRQLSHLHSDSCDPHRMSALGRGGGRCARVHAHPNSGLCGPHGDGGPRKGGRGVLGFMQSKMRPANHQNPRPHRSYAYPQDASRTKMPILIRATQVRSTLEECGRVSWGGGVLYLVSLMFHPTGRSVDRRYTQSQSRN